MAHAALRRIFGLLALLTVGLAPAGPANAVTGGQGALTVGGFYFPVPGRVPVQTGISEKSVCVHVTERSHGSCPSCGTSFVMTLVSRVRPKAHAPRLKADNLSFRFVQAPLAAGRGATRLSAIYGLLSQARSTGTSIFARTGRLRI